MITHAEAGFPVPAPRTGHTAPFRATPQFFRPELADPEPEATAQAEGASSAYLPPSLPSLPSLASLPSLPKPTWSTLIATIVATLALSMWWFGRQQGEHAYIDPRYVIAEKLVAANQAFAAGNLIDPPERSAFHYYSLVLALDPTNSVASAGLAGIADYYLERADASLLTGRVADAAVALEALRRVSPDHRRLAALEVELRHELDALTAAQAEAATIRAIAAPEHAATPTRSASQRSARVAEATVAAATSGPPAIAGSSPVVEPAARSASAGAPPRVDAGAAIAAVQAGAQLKPADAPPLSDAFGAVRGADAAPASAVAASSKASAPGPSGAGPRIAGSSRSLLRYIAPEYPRAARERGLEGWVDMDLSVTPSGDVVDQKVKGGDGHTGFERSALAAVKRWKYAAQPDQSGPEHVQVRVAFRLED